MENKSNKRWVAAFLVFVMVLTVLPSGVVKAAAAATGDPVIIQLSEVSGAESGMNVIISLVIPPNLDLAGVDCKITYDNTKLSYQSYSTGPAASGGLSSFNSNYSTNGDTTIGKYCFIHASGVDSGGPLLNITFTVLPGWTGTSPVTLEILEFFNSELQNINATAKDGGVTVGGDAFLSRVIDIDTIPEVDAQLTLYDKDNGKILKSKSVVINGTDYTTSDKGIITFNDLTQDTVSISADNYYTYLFDTEVLRSLDNPKRKNIYLERLKESDKPYISSIHYKNITDSSYWKDPTVKELVVPEDSTDVFDIKIHALPRSSPVEKIVLSQDEAHKLESGDGVFSSQKLVDVFVSYRHIYAYCVAADGTVSKAVDTLISIKDNDNVAIQIMDTTAFSFDGGPKLTISDDIPIIGGTQIAVDMGHFPFSFTQDGDSYKLALGVNKATFDWSEWISYKSMLKDARDQADSIQKAKKMKDCQKAFGGKSAAGKMIGKGDVDFNVMGYIEWTVVDGSYIITESYVGATVTAKYEWTQPFSVWGVPCYYELGVQIQAGLEGTGKRIVPDSSLPFEWNIVLSVKPSANIGGGIGVPKALSLGVNGRAEFNFHVDFSDKYRKIDLTLAAALKAKAFLLNYEWEFAKKTWTLCSGVYGADKSGATAQNMPGGFDGFEAGIFNPANYSKLTSRDYASKTRWVGDRVSNVAPNDIVIGNTETKTLQTSIYGDSRQQLVECGGKKVLFWITDNQGRAAENRTMLVYSIYDEGSDTWSAPLPVNDDGTADFYPNVATDGTNIYIAWQNSKTLFNASTATLENYAAAGEIRAAKYNPVTGIIESNTVTDNTTLDTMPVVACAGGVTKVVWLNNSANDLFGLTGVNSVCVSTLSGSAWSAHALLKSNLTSVNAMDAAIESGKLYVAYACDMDNDPQDSSDLEIFQIVDNGTTVTASRLTDNAVLDSNPQYGKIGGNTKLLWYSEGNLTALNNLDTAETTALFVEATTVNDSFTIAQSGIDVNYIVWPQMTDGHVEFYATAFDGLAWSEPVALTSYNGKALTPSAVVENDGTMFIGYNKVAQILVTVPGGEGEEDFSYYEDGQTDLCMLKVFQNTDISVSDENLVVHCEDIVPNGTLPLNLSVKNESTVAVDSVDVLVNDALIETIPVNLLPGDSADITVNYTLPAAIEYTELSVRVLPTGTADCDESDNAVTAAYGFTELSIGDLKVEDTALRKIITASVLNDSAVDSGSYKLTIREGGAEGGILHEETYDNLAVGQALLISYSIDKSSVVYDSDGMKKLYFEIVTESPEYSTGNNNCLACFSREDSEGVTSEVLNRKIENNTATVFGVITNNEFNAYNVYAKIEVLDTAQNVIGCLLKKVTLAAKEVYTLEETVPYAGTTGEVRVTILLMDTGTNDIEMTIPAGVTQILAGAFADCADLVKIVIPPSVVSIGEGAFAGCGALTLFGVKGSAAETYAASKSIPFMYQGLNLIKLPDKLEYAIGEALNFTGLRLVFCGTDYAVTDVTNYQVSGYNSGKIGTQTVRLTYGGETVNYMISVHIAYPESDHPYANGTNKTWTYTHPFAVDSLKITFSVLTRTESSTDYIYIYDGSGTQVGRYSGTALAGKTITVPGNSFSIKLTSSFSVSYYGFKIDRIVGIGGSVISPVAGSTCLLNDEEGFIYGLEPGITQEQFEGGYVQVDGGYAIQYSTPSIGTGTAVSVVDNNGAVIASFTIVIFGDVNGDSNINAVDADICALVQNWMIEWDETEDAAFLKAGDVNGDGRVDAVDADIITLSENWMVTINQTTGLAS